MDLFKLSKFKLQLQTLITEVRELREKERASSDQLLNWVQKKKQRDEEFCRKKMELEAELASSSELCQKLERKVQFLEDENYLLESKHKELKETIQSILQAKESFVKAYENSTYEMKRSIESRDRRIAMLSEKINSHILSVDSIRKESSIVKQVVDNAHRVVNEKEEVVARLKIEMDKVCAFENIFIEKVNDLETKLKSKEKDFQRKDRVIAELQTQLEMAKITCQCQSKIEELQETVLVKEGIIQSIYSENKALRSELGMLQITTKTLQDTMKCMDEEGRVAFSLMLSNQEDKEDNRTNHDIQKCKANFHHEASGATVAEITGTSPSCKENKVNSCVSESDFSPSNSVHLESKPAANASSAPGDEKLDSECSTTHAGAS